MQYASPEPIRHGTEKKNIAFYFHDSREAGSNTGTISAHWHSEYEFVYIYAGQASFFLNGTQREVHAGEAVIINKNVIHSSTPSGGEPVRFMCVVFGEQFAFSSMSDALYEEYYLPLYLNNREFPTLVQGTTEWGTRFLTILKSLCESGRKQLPGCDLEWRILLLSLFHLACTEHIFVEGKPSQTRHIVPIRQILTYIEANYTEHLSIPALARQAGMSEVYLHQVFSGRRKPSRDRLLCLCICMGASLEEIQQALKHATYAPLYPKHKRDAIISHGILHGTALEKINEKLAQEQEQALF